MNWPRVFAYIAAIFLVSGGAFGFVQGWEWLDDRHNQEVQVELVGTKVQDAQQRLDYIDLIQAVGVAKKMCELAKRDKSLEPECRSAEAHVNRIRTRLEKK